MSEEKLMVETLESLREYNTKLISGIKGFSNKLENGQREEAFSLLPQIVEGLDWVTKAIELTLDKQQFKINIEVFNEGLNEMAEAIENNDEILLTDILSYEIIPKLEEWQNENFKN
ncbi:hypothetical protein [Bacillus sp. FJAT-45350]|uniref:hypothetical protein n=1 Tax=Bacillus sp. FJAT-45350 TaxID=2011014 RepID=UPI000BB8B7AD|nr:hypothetical protein [Bacillus sp. FJAT-45350]